MWNIPQGHLASEDLLQNAEDTVLFSPFRQMPTHTCAPTSASLLRSSGVLVPRIENGQLGKKAQVPLFPPLTFCIRAALLDAITSTSADHRETGFFCQVPRMRNADVLFVPSVHLPGLFFSFFFFLSSSFFVEDLPCHRCRELNRCCPVLVGIMQVRKYRRLATHFNIQPPL